MVLSKHAGVSLVDSDQMSRPDRVRMLDIVSEWRKKEQESIDRQPTNKMRWGF